jgi:hypothetical protein
METLILVCPYTRRFAHLVPEKKIGSPIVNTSHLLIIRIFLLKAIVYNWMMDVWVSLTMVKLDELTMHNELILLVLWWH